ncbi:MAG: hypothetical protein JNG83_05285 [Opitutaceae bacterium]|nr:hypothetical protein [Opitutaceae bacterium]
MNKSYVIVPIVLLAVFGFFYNVASKEMKAKEDARIAAAAKLKKEEEDRKRVIEEKATADAKKRQDEREAADAAKEKKKQQDYEDALKKLRDETADYASQADRLNKEANGLELQISQGRTDRERLNRESLALAKEVELAKINRRNAELEIQRMIEMLSKKLNESSIAAAPPPPLAPTNTPAK